VAARGECRRRAGWPDAEDIAAARPESSPPDHTDPGDDYRLPARRAVRLPPTWRCPSRGPMSLTSAGAVRGSFPGRRRQLCVRALRVPGPRNPPDGHLVHGAREVVRLARHGTATQANAALDLAIKAVDGRMGLALCRASRAAAVVGVGITRVRVAAPRIVLNPGQLGYRSMAEAISHD
jgi:hypothetical protein